MFRDTSGGDGSESLEPATSGCFTSWSDHSPFSIQDMERIWTNRWFLQSLVSCGPVVSCISWYWFCNHLRVLKDISIGSTEIAPDRPISKHTHDCSGLHFWHLWCCWRRWLCLSWRLLPGPRLIVYTLEWHVLEFVWICLVCYVQT